MSSSVTLHVFNSHSKNYFKTNKITQSLVSGIRYLATHYDITAVLVLVVALEVMKNSNLMLQNISAQIYFAVLIISIVLLSLRKTVGYNQIRTLLGKLGRILGFFFLAGMVDPQIYSQSSKSAFFWPLNFVGRNLTLFGDILPGLYLVYYIYKRFIISSNIKVIYPAIFTSYVSCAFGLLCYHSLQIYLKLRPDPESHFMKHLPLVKIFCEWNILLRTGY